MRLRTGISVPVGPARLYVSPSFTPNRAQDPRRTYMANDPRRAPRPTYNPAQHSAPRDAWRVGRDVRADLAAYRAEQQRAAMGRPSVATYRTQRPAHKPLAYYMVCALGVLVAGFVALIMLGMLGMALHMVPATSTGGTQVPRPGVTATHTTAAHHTTAAGVSAKKS